MTRPFAAGRPIAGWEGDDAARKVLFDAGQLTVDGFNTCAFVETSAGNSQAWLKHPAVLSRLLSTFPAQTLVVRYGADPGAADWRRFGRLPRLYQVQAQVREGGWPLPCRSPQDFTGTQYTLRGTGTGA